MAQTPSLAFADPNDKLQACEHEFRPSAMRALQRRAAAERHARQLPKGA